MMGTVGAEAAGGSDTTGVLSPGGSSGSGGAALDNEVPVSGGVTTFPTSPGLTQPLRKEASKLGRFFGRL